MGCEFLEDEFISRHTMLVPVSAAYTNQGNSSLHAQAIISITQPNDRHVLLSTRCLKSCMVSSNHNTPPLNVKSVVTGAIGRPRTFQNLKSPLISSRRCTV